jgi:hypothetical protein
MPAEAKQPPTNERIMRLVEEIKAELAHSARREEQIARQLGHPSARA